MLNTAIVGGGLCGLALAKALAAQGDRFAVFEARTRLGGRILSLPSEPRRRPVDLGACWIWPSRQPLVVALLGTLGLQSFPQHDSGSALWLRDFEKSPDRSDEPLHGEAHRLDGGMGRLVDALASALDPGAIRLDHHLLAVRDQGDHVALDFRHGGLPVSVQARRVVLAVPPRLLDAHVVFEPDLDADLRAAMLGASTWMASSAKAAMTFERPLWRDKGQSGNAVVTHAEAVLGEIYDACDREGHDAALGAFLALTPDLREAFAAGLPLLIRNQIGQVFGTELEEGELLYQDWAAEPLTCSAADRAEPRGDQPTPGNPLLRRPQWQGRLYFGSTETGGKGAGYLEGALEAAARIAESLAPQARSDGEDGPLGGFQAWVAAQSEAVFDFYRAQLKQDLARQQRDQLTQRAILGAVEALYRDALAQLAALSPGTTQATVEKGRCSLMTEVQRPFGELLRTLFDDVLAFNRTSCALSNFPDEHRVPMDYRQVIMRDLAAAWQDFSLSANRLLLDKIGWRKAPSASVGARQGRA